MAIPSNCACLSSSPASCSGAGTLSVPQNKPFPEGAHTVNLTYFVRSPNLCTFCALPVPGAKSTEAAVLPIACLQEYMVRGKINRARCSCTRYFTYVLHTPTNLLPVDIPYPCQAEGNPWTYLPLCPLTVQPTSDVKKFSLKQSGSYHVNKVAFFWVVQKGC